MDDLTDKFCRVVSFDTMTDKDLPDYSFTLRKKSLDYKHTRRSRTFMVATDLADYSEHALDWTTDNIMDDFDEIVILRVVTLDMNDKKANPLALGAKKSREDANQVMNHMMATASNLRKKISVIIEFVVGKVQDTIYRMLSMYQPSLLVVGTRGLSGFKGMMLSSVSKYCLQHSPVPVTIIKPENHTNKKPKRLIKLLRMASGGSIPTLSDYSSSKKAS
ncbi:Universal stress protein A family protein C25B2.10 [Choanephora cucurbitarum]|uniref:Universal stress protein A family protein C25B2.10 n=1 Tax=Choanephora cucurbitarum TaxID=101091 RepID=A0A1C7N4K6_9FUNG|nr:Universal stress protein A family protein C25B2.10 [Choanephora cucurbitarum]